MLNLDLEMLNSLNGQTKTERAQEIIELTIQNLPPFVRPMLTAWTHSFPPLSDEYVDMFLNGCREILGYIEHGRTEHY